MYYINSYNNESDYNTAKGRGDFKYPHLSLVESDMKIKCDPYTPNPPYPGLRFTSIGESRINADTYFVGDESLIRGKIEYSADDGQTWIDLPILREDAVCLSDGEYILVRGNNIESGFFGWSFYTAGEGFVKVSGNIMSLIDNGECLTDIIPTGSSFSKLFQHNLTLVDAEDLQLPATVLTSDCYKEMFLECFELTKCPKVLPAKNLADRCYMYMFSNCTKLHTTPKILAENLAEDCCYGMFNSCAITNAPNLPATNLARGCYYCMFSDCTVLVNPPQLPATELAPECYMEMFNNCKSLEEAPELSATVLPALCYSGMFIGCENLRKITCMAQNTNGFYCLDSWVSGVQTVSGIFKKIQNIQFPIGISGIPENWEVIEYND